MTAHRVGPSSQHPFEIFVLVLCVGIGIPLLFGEPTQGSISALLPRWAAYVWGASLSLGALVALVGVALARGRSVFTGVLLEQAGLGFVALATIFYAATVLYVGGSAGLTASAFVLGFGLSCVWRFRQIQKIINTGSSS